MLEIQWTIFTMVLGIISVLSIIGFKYRRGKEAYLCGDCRFNNDDDCQKKERPQALICTSYREKSVLN